MGIGKSIECHKNTFVRVYGCHLSAFLGDFRRSPKGAWICAVRVELEHGIVKLAGGRCRFIQTIEITKILSCFCNDVRIICIFWNLVSSNDRLRIERFELIERRDPFEPALLIGFSEVGMDPVVHRISTYEQTDRWNMEAG
jgi:hypothetical protein